MTPKDKTKDRAPREATQGPLLDRLKPGEAATVLRHLLKAHPDLSSEAYEIARSLLRQLEYGDVAAEIEDEIRALDYEDLNARAGGHKWGYVEPSEAAWEILEETVEPVLDDMKRHIELGLEAEALEICKGMVLGLYRLSERQGGDVLGWAPDFPDRGGWKRPGILTCRSLRAEESRHPSKNAPSASSGLPEHGSQVDSHDRAHLERDEVTPTARPWCRRRLVLTAVAATRLACRPLVRGPGWMCVVVNRIRLNCEL
jgi:hypothetical protein